MRAKCSAAAAGSGACPVVSSTVMERASQLGGDLDGTFDGDAGLPGPPGVRRRRVPPPSARGRVAAEPGLARIRGRTPRCRRSRLGLRLRLSPAPALRRRTCRCTRSRGLAQVDPGARLRARCTYRVDDALGLPRVSEGRCGRRCRIDRPPSIRSRSRSARRVYEGSSSQVNTSRGSAEAPGGAGSMRSGGRRRPVGLGVRQT